LAAVAVLFFRYVVFPPKFLSGYFIDARLKGAAISENIVFLSRENLSNLNKAADFDRKRNYPEALIAISNAVIATREIQNEALRLSSQLATMAEYISGIRPIRARDLATEAITAQVALVNRLLAHNSYMNELFEKLKVKFEKPWVAYLDGQVNDLVNRINDEVSESNELNKRSTEFLAELDLIFKK
jgi:hypothetical protein